MPGSDPFGPRAHHATAATEEPRLQLGWDEFRDHGRRLTGHRLRLEGRDQLGRHVELQVLLEGLDQAEVLRFQVLDLGGILFYQAVGVCVESLHRLVIGREVLIAALGRLADAGSFWSPGSSVSTSEKSFSSSDVTTSWSF